jgi:phage gpG-like protein
MLKIKFGSAKALSKISAEIAALKAGEQAANEVAGQRLADEMKRTIDEELEPWPALSPRTIALKGHDKVLIEDRTMRDSITYKTDGKYVTVGVHDDAPKDRGKIALIHEHGAPEAGIPARPFVQPTWDREKGNILALFELTLKKGLI